MQLCDNMDGICTRELISIRTVFNSYLVKDSYKVVKMYIC